MFAGAVAGARMEILRSAVRVRAHTLRAAGGCGPYVCGRGAVAVTAAGSHMAKTARRRQRHSSIIKAVMNPKCT